MFLILQSTGKIMVRELISEEDIKKRLESLAVEISKKCTKNVLVIGLLKGGFVFTADLFRALDKAGMTPGVDFMRLSSYGSSKESSGEVLLSGNVPSDVEGREILVVDDILDSGRSLAYAKSIFVERGASKVMGCVLLDKPARREVDITADFIGFEVDDLFVVGYGIDYDENYRHLPYVGTVE